MGKPETCKRCKSQIGRKAKSGFCQACANGLQRDMAAAGECPSTGVTREMLNSWWQRNAGPVIAEKSQTPAEYVADVARENQIAHDWNAKVVTLKEDCLVVSDIHIPQHDPEYLRAVCKVGIAHGIKTLVIGGDLIDCQELSSFVKDSPSAHTARE